jgi:crotonobetainyl-CoA:carnitine CoA-transferase CaiB-like acyl-CoA transferase
MIDSALDDLRVLEIGGQRGEFCGKLLAGNGADVIRIEPPGGVETRQIGPFYHDEPHPERSLYWWNYNFGKRSLTLDLERPEGQALFRRLVERADIVLESFDPGYLAGLGLDYAALRAINPRLIMISITNFGQDGPWRDFLAGDLNLLAIGGQMMVCGYAPTADGSWDTPPIAPQMWHAYHIGGNLAFMDLMAALLYRDDTGRGQYIDFSVHEACNNCTEPILPWFLYGGRVARRQAMAQARAKDGVEVLIMPPLFPGEFEKMVQMLDDAGMAEDLTDPFYLNPPNRRDANARHINEVARRYIEAHDSDFVFHNAQRRGVVWCPIRAPADNAADEHFRIRGAIVDVAHPELGESFAYPGQPRVAEHMPWRFGPRAPLIGEHTRAILQKDLQLGDAELDALAAGGVI